MVAMSASAIARNITAALAAVGSIYRITDFQGNCIDLENGRTGNGIGIMSRICTDNSNQQWILTPDDTGRFFKVTNVAAQSVVMAVPGVTDAPTVVIRSLEFQPLTSQINSIMLWDMQLNTNFPSSDPSFPFAFK
ncbi:hypothetical protein CVT24_003745 [Panaeolus cyanescens]|uniref:Ricin B lectin domain-containing protein n=1 Tax=Panaeolus cyanescens TaxID=181874 RepID=A0A409YXL1_9AGAR|nr:hypothetical protein CVT24_003745 [Panaeolus cyanescens]